MSVLAESARLSEQGQFYPASPGTWRDNLGGDDLMSVVAESTRRTEQPQFYAAGTVPSSPGYGLDASAWPPVAEAGGSSVAQPVLPSATPATWRESLGGGDLMSVVAESARRTEQPQFYAAGTASSPGYGLDASAWPPFAETGGSSAAQPAQSPLTPGTWRESLGGDDLMSVVAGRPWQSTNSFEVPAAVPAEADPSLHSLSGQPPWSSRIRQEELGQVPSLVDAGFATDTVPSRIGRSSRSGGRPRSLSVAQIETALQAQAEYISRTGYQRGSIKAAYEAVGSSAGNWDTFRGYFSKDGLSEYGQRVLEDTRRVEERLRQSEQLQAQPSGTVPFMASGSAPRSLLPEDTRWAEERLRQSEQPQVYPSGTAPGMASSSTRRSRLPRSSRISEEDFQKVASLVKGGATAGAALESIGRSDLPAGTVRHWLAEAGVVNTGRHGRSRVLSVEQISAALQAQREYTQEKGMAYGSIRGAYDKLGFEGSVSYAGFRQYFTDDGLSRYGRTMLEQARRAESAAAHEEGSSRLA